MTATNHALTGAVIGLTIGNPFVALPAALLSHFVCDAMPHYGPTTEERTLLRSRGFAVRLLVDALLCGLLVLALVLTSPLHWQLAALCAFVAAAPDFASLPRFRSARSNAWNPERASVYERFAKKIQWFERPIGAFVELAWCAAGVIIVVAYL